MSRITTLAFSGCRHPHTHYDKGQKRCVHCNQPVSEPPYTMRDKLREEIANGDGLDYDR